MKPFKRIYDPVHKFIHFDKLESEFIDSRLFHRLRYIRQLGITYMVYPGATHSRFEHSLGVMEISTRIYDLITSVTSFKYPSIGTDEHIYWRRILRLSSLCHDIGHLPFSHAAERIVLGKDGHEVITKKIIESNFISYFFDKFYEESKSLGIDRDIRLDVMKVALGKKNSKCSFTPWESVLTNIITGNFFGADRIDYLLRDAKCSGLAYGVFDYTQLIEMLTIIEMSNDDLSLGIEENGISSCEALLLARHYMYKRLYQYERVKSYTYHISRFMKVTYPNLNDDLNYYISITDNEVLSELNRAAYDKAHPGYLDASCIFVHKNRFIAIELDYTPDSDLICKLKDKFENNIDFEVCKDLTTNTQLPFLVLKKDGSIDIGDNLSEISIPSKNNSWVYVSPEYEMEVKKWLNINSRS